MDVRLSDEAAKELRTLRELDELLGAGLDECLSILGLDIDEFSGDAGYSIEPIVAFKKKGIYVFRLRYDAAISGVRVFFFRLRDGVFVTGIHRREDLGGDYDTLREPFTRAQRYWGRRRYL